jgi:alpha-mannosidase
MRLLEQKLITAEKLAGLASWLGAPTDQAALWRAWEPVLFNETHDLASGVMTDHVYEDTVRNDENANRSADELIDAGWNILASKIDTRGPGIPIVVFNPLGWHRTDVVEVTLDDFDDGETGASLVDEAGDVLPAQYTHSSAGTAGKPSTASVAFLARDVPAMGHRTYRYIRRGPTTISAFDTATGNSIENSFYKVSFDLATGSITGLRVKNGNWEVFSSAANVVARQPDKGDLWELYRGLDGGSKIAMTTRQEVPVVGQAVFTNQFSDKAGVLGTGPVFSEFTVSHPFGTGNYATTVRVYEGLHRIDCRIRLVNNEKYVRYQALFPTTIKRGKSVHEIPFGAIERPSGIEFPAQNWVDYGDGQRGLAVLNIGLTGNVISGGTMMVSLLRAQNLGAYGFGGGYEPGMSSETGFQLGVERSMRYALLPHQGDWKDAGVFRDALEFNHPLVARVAEPHVGILPNRRGFVDVSSPGVVLSDLKPGRGGGIALRLYEATGRPADGVTVTLHSQVLSASAANLLEDPGESLALSGSSVRLDFRPFEIKTILFRPSAGKPKPRPPKPTSAGRASLQ